MAGWGRTRLVECLAAAALALPLHANAEDVDLSVVNRIKREAFLNSHVMDYLQAISDENGPRVTGSPGYRRAAERAVAELKSAGVEQAGLESWGHFGIGWSWTRVAVQMKTPQETTLTAYPADWSPGTAGPVEGDVVFAPLWAEGEVIDTGNLLTYAAHIEQWKNTWRGKLRGHIVMFDRPVPFTLPAGKPRFRYPDNGVLDTADIYYDGPLQPGRVPKLMWPLVAYPVNKEEYSHLWDVMPLEFAADRWDLEARVRGRIAAFLREEGVAAVLLASARGGAVIMHSDYGSWREDAPVPPPSVALMPEQYARIHRLLERKVQVRLSVDVGAEFYPGAEGTNVIAELPGHGRGGELVMLGAHFDSWHGATGATDNGAGSAVVMEAMRILAALDLPLGRTVRMALWDGEEQCLCGSRGYVKKHFADPVSMKLMPDHDKLSVYFNLDNGGGRIRGVYLQQNDMARPILDAWLAPFADLGAGNVTIVNTTGTDHLSFDAVGLPGFEFVQDPLDYALNTHHSNVDDVGHVIPGDLMQASAIMANAVYQASVRKERMPRKPLPSPLPQRGELPDILR